MVPRCACSNLPRCRAPAPVNETVKWSGRRGSNPQPTAWEAATLPLSYSRSKTMARQNCSIPTSLGYEKSSTSILLSESSGRRIHPDNAECSRGSVRFVVLRDIRICAKASQRRTAFIATPGFQNSKPIPLPIPSTVSVKIRDLSKLSFTASYTLNVF